MQQGEEHRWRDGDVCNSTDISCEIIMYVLKLSSADMSANN